jgi:hypothetical protein
MQNGNLRIPSRRKGEVLMHPCPVALLALKSATSHIILYG